MPARKTTKKGSTSNTGIFIIAVVVLCILGSIFGSSEPSSSSTLKPTRTPVATKTAKSNLSQFSAPTSTKKPISLHACVTDSTARIRRGPGTQYEVIGGLVSGTCMSIVGRNQDSDWVYMTSEDNKTGWVFASLLTIEGDISRVSVQSVSEVLSLAPSQKLPPTTTRQVFIFPTNTPRPLVVQPTPKKNNCSPAYPGVCIPPAPPDLDCGDISYSSFTVLSPDPHNFDRDGDGIGCE